MLSNKMNKMNKNKPKPATQKHFEYLCDLHVLLLSPLIFPYILFIRFMRYLSVGCMFDIRSARYVSVSRSLHIRSSEFSIFVILLFACPLCIRYTSVLFNQYINGLTTDNNFVNGQLLFLSVWRPFVLSGKV